MRPTDAECTPNDGNLSSHFRVDGRRTKRCAAHHWHQGQIKCVLTGALFTWAPSTPSPSTPCPHKHLGRHTPERLQVQHSSQRSPASDFWLLPRTPQQHYAYVAWASMRAHPPHLSAGPTPILIQSVPKTEPQSLPFLARRSRMLAHQRAGLHSYNNLRPQAASDLSVDRGGAVVASRARST